MARKLVVEIIGDASSLDKSLRHAHSSVQRFSVGIGTILKSAVVFDAVQAGIRGVTGALSASIDEFTQQQQVATQTTAVLKSTGGAANVTAKQVDQLATSILNYSGIDDEAVKAGENMLLTFTHVQNAVGAGHDIFNQATTAVADLATAMNKGAAPSMDQMTTAALQVGKALNDPVKGYARLQRIGVQFTKEQVAQIKGFERVGDTVDAQRVILAELTKEFGGSAREMGQSIPGEINRIRESFRNLGGSIVGAFAPSLTRALESVNGFVDQLTAARTVRAKLNVVWEGTREAAVSAFMEVRDAFDRINWDQLWTRTKEIARSLLASLEAAFASVDWAQLGSTVGGKVRAALDAVTGFISSIDWQKVGKAVINGLLIGLGGLTVALAGFFQKAWPAVMRLWIAEVKAAAGLLAGIGKQVGSLLLQGLSNGLDTVGRFLEKKMIWLVLKIIEPFTHIGGPLVGRLGAPFREIKANLQQRLDDLAKSAQQPAAATGIAIGSSLGAGVVAGFKTSAPVISAAGANAIHDAADRVATNPPIPKAPPAKIDPKAAAKRAARRNTWVDAMIDRQLGTVQDIVSVSGQIARLRQISGLISAQIAAVHDVTRKLNLRDKQLDILRQIRTTQMQNAIDVVSLGVDRAGLTTRVSDDITALRAVNAKLAEQNRVYGVTIAREQQIISNQQQIKSLQQQQQQTRFDWAQYRVDRTALTDNTRDDLKALRVQENLVKQQIKAHGRTLDLLQQLLQVQLRIKDVRDKSALAGLRQVSSKQLANVLASGTGLDAAGRRVLGMNIAAAEIQPTHIHVHLDGREVATVVSKQQARTGRRTAAQTSGFRG